MAEPFLQHYNYGDNFPRLSTSLELAIPNIATSGYVTPVVGMLTLNPSDLLLYYYNGTSWIAPGGTGTVTSVGLTSTDITIGGTASPITSSGAFTLTLPATGVVAATYGSSTSIPSFTVTAKGLITSASGNVVIAPAGTLTGTTLASNVVTTSITSTGTMTSGSLSTGYVIGGVTMTLTSDATGDIYYRSAGGLLTRLGIGSVGQVLTVAGGLPSWATGGAGTVTSVSGTASRITSTGGTTPIIDIDAAYVGQTSITTLGVVTAGTISTGAIIGKATMTLGSDATGDMYYRDAGGILTRTPIGTSAQVLIGGTIPAFGTLAIGNTSGVLSAGRGGTGQSTYATGDTLYASALNTLSKLSGNTTTTKKSLTQTGDGVNSAAPIWEQLAASDLSNGTTGTGLIVLATSPTLVTPDIGTPSAGTLTNCTGLPIFGGTTGTLSETRGGTNQTTYLTGDILYASASNTLSKLNVGSNGQVLTLAAGLPSWATPTTGTVTSVSGTANQIGSTGGATPVISIVTNPIFPGAPTIVAPGNATQNIITTDATQTLSNKTLTKPLINASYESVQTYTPSAAGTATIDLSLANKNNITMPAGNITIALSNASTGQCFALRILQDGTGSRTVTWFSTIKWAGGTVPTLTTTASKADWFGFVCTGSGTYDGFIMGQNF